MKENLELVEQWDKTFPISNRVHHRKVTFHNRYGITLAADLYIPKEAKGKLPAIAVCGPFGAVKEQSSGLYAQTMAEQGFLTLAFDPSFTGESGGYPRYMASPDINTEDYQAAVDFLSVQEIVDPEKIGLIGICGWGGMALNAAAIDTRVKVTVTMTMYDMSRVNANGYFDLEDNENVRFEKKKVLNTQRIADYKNGTYARGGGVVALQYADEIRSAVLIVHGEKAHSCYFSKDAFAKLTGNNKELLLIPDAVHTDLYDQVDIIPFDKITEFFRKWL